MQKKQKRVQARGGKREGAGRRQIYKEQMTEKVPVRLNEGQSQAVTEWCQKNKIAAMMFLREAALFCADAQNLGLGLKKCYGSAKNPRLTGGDKTIVPITFTPSQYEAIEKKAGKDVPIATFIREAALKVIGRPELGVTGEAAKVRQAVV